jgi:hypothetical protein
MVTAELAREGWSGLHSVMLGDPLARRAIDSIWVEEFDQPFETSRIVWEVPAELVKRVPTFAGP